MEEKQVWVAEQHPQFYNAAFKPTVEVERKVKWDLRLLPVFGKEGGSHKARLSEFIHIPGQYAIKWGTDYVILRDRKVENWFSYAFERSEWKIQHA